MTTLSRLGLAVCSSFAMTSAVFAEKRDVDLKADDGERLKATYHAAAKPGPAVVLFHMCNGNRAAWDTLSAQLAARGVHAIAMDYRGFGESGGKRSDTLTAAEWHHVTETLWPRDFDAVLAYLRSQPGVDATSIGASGASCGVEQALQLARRNPEVKALALLAGGLSQSSEEFLARSPHLALFAAAAEDDGDAVSAMDWLLGFSSGDAKVMKAFTAGGHGTDIFRTHEDLQSTIADWFVKELTEPAAPSRARPPAPGPSAVLAARLREPGGAARVLEEHRQAAKTGASMKLPPESAARDIGYQLVQSGRHQDAISLFTLNVEAHPTLCLPYLTLSDAYAGAGQSEKAVEYARRALQATETDTTSTDGAKQHVRSMAESRIRGLTSPSHP